MHCVAPQIAVIQRKRLALAEIAEIYGRVQRHSFHGLGPAADLCKVPDAS
jgi:hypothetical protein